MMIEITAPHDCAFGEGIGDGDAGVDGAMLSSGGIRIV